MEEKSNKLQEVMERLEQGIQDVFGSENYRNYLRFMSKFHNYSYNNTILMLMQNPEASMVAGYKAWQTKFKRQVKKGEKGMMILAPAPYKTTVTVEKLDPITKKPVLDPQGNAVLEKKEITKPYFRVVYVFDVSQTDGDPIPELTPILTDSVKHYDLLFESLKSVSPFPITFEKIHGGAKGYCTPEKIVINTDMGQAQNIKTAIHEITHADIHCDKDIAHTLGNPDRQTREVQAESVAFIVCDHYGIDTSDYSFGYLAGWSSGKELKELKQSLDTIQHQAADLIDRIDSKFLELQKEELRRQNEMLDTVRHDNDIDLDRERSREQLGFNDSIKDRMASAQAAAASHGKEQASQREQRGGHER